MFPITQEAEIWNISSPHIYWGAHKISLNFKKFFFVSKKNTCFLSKTEAWVIWRCKRCVSEARLTCSSRLLWPKTQILAIIQWVVWYYQRYLLQDANLFEINLMDFLPGSRNLLSTIQKVYQHFACIGCCWKIIFYIYVIWKALNLF